MLFLILLAVSATAFAQAPLIGVNSTAGALRAGARDVVISITVDPSPSGGDLLAVMLTADGVQIRIELPDGRFITKETAAAAGFTWEVSGQGQGDDLLIPGLQGRMNHLVLLPTKAPAGKYKIHADASALKEDAALMLEFVPVGGAVAPGQRDTVRVALESSATFHYAGQKVELVAGVFDGDRGIDNADLSGEAVAVDDKGMPSGPSMRVKFRSSGRGTGSYNAELPTTAVGKYEVGLKVRGKYRDGTEFERNAGASITIEPRRAQVLGVTERPLDDDGNGLIDRLELTAHIKTDLPGEYNLVLDLRASTGQYMQAYGKAVLGVGDGTITALIDRYSLIHLGADGPYKISARLFRREGQGEAFASLLENAGETRVYKQSSFDHGPIYFAGTAQATPESASGKSPFAKLTVSLEVFTPGGRCFWYGGLTSGRNSIEFLNNQGVLPQGTSQIALTFDGHKISDAADGKPLEIGKVALTCGGFHAPLEKPVTLPTFPSGTFAKAAPSFQLRIPQLVAPMQRGKVATLSLEIQPEGGFDQTLDLAIEGLPEGIVLSDWPASTPARRLGPLMFHLAVSADAPSGRYEITVRANYKTMERVATTTLVLDK